jgi:7-cyano-7-deazaguanine synthase in queuosine biosynthesis
MMNDKYVSILSGGLDSVVNLYWAASEGEVVKAVTFDYGQRAAAKPQNISAMNLKYPTKLL